VTLNNPVTNANIPPSTGTTTDSDLARHIQSTLISNSVTRAQWQAHIDDCLKYHFHAAMIAPCWAHETGVALRSTGIRTASFVDFPLGTMTASGKAFAARKLVEDGVEEIDLMQAGADLVGTSSGAQIMQELLGASEQLNPRPQSSY
jgi:deoxyribose-phosphate aldolase